MANEVVWFRPFFHIFRPFEDLSFLWKIAIFAIFYVSSKPRLHRTPREKWRIGFFSWIPAQKVSRSWPWVRITLYLPDWCGGQLHRLRAECKILRGLRALLWIFVNFVRFFLLKTSRIWAAIRIFEKYFRFFLILFEISRQLSPFLPPTPVWGPQNTAQSKPVLQNSAKVALPVFLCATQPRVFFARSKHNCAQCRGFRGHCRGLFAIFF